jgi:hypothetical protein
MLFDGSDDVFDVLFDGILTRLTSNAINLHSENLSVYNELANIGFGSKELSTTTSHMKTTSNDKLTAEVFSKVRQDLSQLDLAN